jgi:hypothetical protein
MKGWRGAGVAGRDGVKLERWSDAGEMESRSKDRKVECFPLASTQCFPLARTPK